MYARRSAGGVTVANRLDAASKKPKKPFGSTRVCGDTLSTFDATWPFSDVSTRASSPANVMLTVFSRSRTVPSRINDTGDQSDRYRTSARRVTISSGGERRPVPEMIRSPFSVRTVMSSRPIGVPRRKTVYPRVSGSCATLVLAPSARSAQVR
jgi:hypothetical protein